VKRNVTGVREKVTFIGSVLEEADSPLPSIEESHHRLRGFVFQRLSEEAIDNDVGEILPERSTLLIIIGQLLRALEDYW
jgi:hypothetical protein